MTRTSRILAATVGLALAAPAAAPAATVSMVDSKAVFTAASGESNNLVVRNVTGGIEFEDAGAASMTAGAGCSVVAPKRVRCPVTVLPGVVVDAGDGNDTVDDDLYVTPFTTYGGLGNDVLRGGGGPDTMDGGPGNDSLDGSFGNDVLVGAEGVDALVGGSGRDRASYMERSAAVSVSLDDVANDGAAGETDNVASSVEDVTGGAGSDALAGSGDANELIGGAGDDALDGAAGDDALDGGPGADTFAGGAGIDNLKARDGVQETLACGSEADSAEADHNDGADADCEVVNRDAAPPLPPLPPVAEPELPPAPTGGTGNVIEEPVATLAGSSVPVSASGVASVRLKCPSEAFEGCQGSILIEALDAPGAKSKTLVSARRRPTKLATRRFKVAAGKGATIPVRLDRRNWRKFRKRKRVKVQITVTMENATGTTTSTSTVSLRPARPKR